MSSPCRSPEGALALAALLALAAPAAAAMPERLRVCSDPNNLPFSNAEERGFENRIARLLARDLGVPLAGYGGSWVTTV